MYSPKGLRTAIDFGLAEASAALRDLDSAAEYYHKVVDAVPDHSKAVGALAQTEFLRHSRSRSNSKGSAVSRRILSLDSIEKLFLRALDCNPDDTQNLINFAQFMKTARNNLEGAKGLLYKATLLQPCNGGILGNYAAVLSKSGDLKRAEVWCQHPVSHVFAVVLI